MSLDAEEANETQQLMQNEVEEDEPKISQVPTSPVISNKLSSGTPSCSSKVPAQPASIAGNSSLNESSKVSYINERRLHRDMMKSNHKPKNSVPKDTTDVKHMEKALLELLDDFHTGKLSAFGTGTTMEQMINIRDQQENLARLHFRLCAETDKPTEESFDSNIAQNKMSQLVTSLEHLSASIEDLHSENVSSNTEK